MTKFNVLKEKAAIPPPETVWRMPDAAMESLKETKVVKSRGICALILLREWILLTGNAATIVTVTIRAAETVMRMQVKHAANRVCRVSLANHAITVIAPALIHAATEP